MKATPSQWQQLYQAAIAFKQAACWDWMENIHIFGIRHPASKPIGYGCIMGHAREMFGLAVYIGEDGLSTMFDMLNGQSDPIYKQHCLMLSFDDREELHPEEKVRVKELGLKFRGKQAWPTFRLYEPGYYPWPIRTADEVSFLTAAIEQAIVVAIGAKADPDNLLAPKADRLFLTRVADPQPDGRMEWHTEWLEPEDEVGVPDDNALPMDEIRVARAKKTVQQRAGIWEVDLFYVPSPIREGERPYFPMIFLVVDQGSGQILGVELSKKDEIAGLAMERLFRTIEAGRRLPAKLVALEEQVLDTLLPAIRAMDLDCFLADKLHALEEAKRRVISQMGG